ncbi:MAG: FkbM family methyltransferase [Gemmatimonadota bacterium]
MLTGHLEGIEPDLVVVGRLVAPGDTVLDVGANYGIYTKFLSDLVGVGGRVISLEPIPETFDLLAANVASLGLSNVRLHQRAASDHIGTVGMIVPNTAEGANYYQARVVEGPSRNACSVVTTTLDLLTQDDSERVTFIKCDVEGHELAVLRGAQRLLRDRRPALLVEVAGDPDEAGSQANVLFADLRSLSYSAYVRREDRVVSRSPGDRVVNYFFLQADQAEALLLDG